MQPATTRSRALYTVLTIRGYENHVFPVGTGWVAKSIARLINDYVKREVDMSSTKQEGLREA